MRRRLALITTSAIIVFLDLAALSDITGGHEPKEALLGEYLVIVVSIPTLFFLSYLIFLKKRS